MRQFQLMLPEPREVVTGTPVVSGLTPGTLLRTPSSTFQVSKAESQTVNADVWFEVLSKITTFWCVIPYSLADMSLHKLSEKPSSSTFRVSVYQPM
jgi:hypothetical protein